MGVGGCGGGVHKGAPSNRDMREEVSSYRATRAVLLGGGRRGGRTRGAGDWSDTLVLLLYSCCIISRKGWGWGGGGGHTQGSSQQQGYEGGGQLLPSYSCRIVRGWAQGRAHKGSGRLE